ncbi:hypothetical protein DB346_07965 [Verrucomicrobia bacterium LW23]|nr:hypothetical protein DB346_07965 [Verrucomicrobia bacterium LW23]
MMILPPNVAAPSAAPPRGKAPRFLAGIRSAVRVTGLLILTATCCVASAYAGKDPKLSLSEKGIQINAGPAGTFTMQVPGLRVNDKDYTGEKPVTELTGDTLVAKYPSGAEVKITLDSSTAEISVIGAPASAKALVFVTMIPIQFNGGGKAAIGKKGQVAFPEEKDKQLITDGWGETFTLIDPSGEGYAIAMPGDYQQVQDNRVFNWAVFAHIYNYSFAAQKGKTNFTLRFGGVDGATASKPAPAAKKPAASAAAPPAAVPRPGAGSGEARKFIVDRYGQSVRKDFPGKVKDDAELKADGERMTAELAAYKPNPALDIYGGLAGSGKQYGLAKTGFFHLGKVNGRDVLVTPEGNMFFQLGMCGIASTDDYTKVGGREKIYEWLPAKDDERFTTAWREKKPEWGIFSYYIANWIRKFDRPFTSEEWNAQAVTRLRSWGFNSAGAFSNYGEAMKAANFPTVTFLPLGEGGGVQVLPDKLGAGSLIDPFVPGTEEALDARFAKSVAPKANDPLIIGFFLSNEVHVELLPKKIPTYKASKVAAKRKLVETLQAKYKDIARFNEAWKPARPYASFEDLKEEPLFVRSQEAAADMTTFYIEYMEAYSSMVQRLFRKHNPNHLLIGSRLTPGTATNEIAVRISGKYTDIVSINYYTYAIEESFLKRVHEWSGGKPMIFSEWYYAATDHGLNGGKELKDQAERAKGYRNYIEQSAALPFVVGSQWFIYTDQSITGRFFEGFNGEGANTGLVDVTDRPYQPVVDAAKETHARVYDVMLGKTPAFAYDDPRFNGKSGGGADKVVVVPRALPGMKMDGSTTNWPGRPAEPIESSRVVHGGVNPALRGDFRLCWDDDNLYFLVQVKDPTPLKTNKGDKHLWAADCVELFIGVQDVDTPGTMIFSDKQVLIGASESPKMYIADNTDGASARQCQSLVTPEVTGDGYVLQCSIPWKVLGVTPKGGMQLLFDVAIDNSDDGDYRKQQLVWNGTSKNSTDRGAWGRAKLVDN